ncbi:MAG: flippase-like domain-containing protein, partial [Bacteroidales bacterium]|nr:flippase-like domain-containing protein [Bacteroidales bacterium]
MKLLLKIVVAVLAYAFVVYKLLSSPDLSQIPDYFANASPQLYAYLVILVLLMPANWTMEVWKWMLLTRKVEEIDFAKSLKAVMTGVTVGTITPNRVGEFAGRILFVKEENRASVSFLTIFGDLAQFCATIIFGIIGLICIGGKTI